MAMKLKCKKYLNSLMSNKCILNNEHKFYSHNQIESIVIDHIERVI